MEELAIVVIGGGLSYITSLVGQKFPNTNNLLILAALSIILGVFGYAVFFFWGSTPTYDHLAKVATGGWAWAVALYQLFKNISK